MHNFWDAKDPSAKMLDQISFYKNVALAGALLFYLAMKRDNSRLRMSDKLKSA